jgi:hypothetical protein
MKNLAVGCLSLIIGLVAGAGFVFFLTSNAPKPTASIAAPAATGRPEVSVNVSAAYASSQIQQALRATGVAKNSTVTFAPPNLIHLATTIDVNALGLTLAVDANVTQSVAVQNGRVALTTNSVEVGGLTLSPSVVNSTIEPVRAQSESEINRIIQRALSGTGLRLSNIAMTTDSVTIELTSP